MTIAPPVPFVPPVPPAPADAEEMQTLRAVAEGTAQATGEAFFDALVANLARSIDVAYAFVAEFTESRRRVRTRAFWARGAIQPDVEFDLQGTPCEDVVGGRMCHHPERVQTLFPDDTLLVELGIESYLGVPLLDESGEVLGHLAVCDTRPMSAEPKRLLVFRVFAARAAAELQRLRAVQLLEASESRYRDLFDEAPVGYLATGTDGRFRAVNRAAAAIVGCAVEDMVGRPALSFVADTPAGKPRARQILAALGAGEDVDDVELELHRTDGRPAWVRMWMHPMREGDGHVGYSRSIWIDVTRRVLAERDRALLQQHNEYLREELHGRHRFDEIVGRAAPIRRVLELVEQVAGGDAPVLLLGESGTGKELIARAVHNASTRRDRPLVKVNCAALPPGLVESELFGHEKGAFTGATSRRVGRFALADGGTIFLDEIAEMPLDVQVKLLRVLQEMEFEPVGSGRTQRVDVRVIAATNRDLARAMAGGAFRGDLFYRLNVFPITLPPLRERSADVALLARCFLERFARRYGKPIDDIEPASLRRLAAYPWPGNVRELENVIERGVILARSGPLVITGEMLDSTGAPAPVPVPAPGATTGAEPAPARPPGPDGAGGNDSLRDVERRHIQRTLEGCGWIVEGPQGAATRLGINPSTLRSRMKSLGLRRPGRGRS